MPRIFKKVLLSTYWPNYCFTTFLFQKALQSCKTYYCNKKIKVFINNILIILVWKSLYNLAAQNISLKKTLHPKSTHDSEAPKTHAF